MNHTQPIYARNVTTCKRGRTIDKVAVGTSLRRKKAHRGRLWKMMGKEQYVLEMWGIFLLRRSKM